MRRHIGIALIATIVLTLSLLFLPASLATRGQAEVETSKQLVESAQRADALSLSNLIKPPVRQQSDAAPIVMRAGNFAVSAPVSELPPTARLKEMRGKQQNIVRDRPFEKDGVAEENEINKENNESIRNLDPNATRTVDTALSYKRLSTAVVPQALPTPAVSFDGISEADTVTIGQGFLPPDTNGEVGPNHFVQTVNSAFRVWDKSGNPLTPLASLSSLFAPLGAPCGTSDDGDPVTLYDQLSDRWLITQFCIPSGSTNTGPFHELIAVSKTGNPAGSYYLYDFITQGTNIFPDYPHLGVWSDGYYMTVNQFSGNTFVNSGMYAFDRNKMIAGDPTAAYVFFNSNVLFSGQGVGGMLPADLDGYTPPPAGAPCPFAYFTAGEFGDPAPANTDALRFFDFHVDFTTPANSTFTERAGSPLAVAAFDPNTVPAGSRNVVPQPPPATAASFLDAISDRLMFRLAYRNFGNKETLVVNHTVNASGSLATFRAGVRLYQLSRATPTATWGIDEQTTWAGALPTDTDHRWMGSAAQNYLGDLVLGFSASSLTTNPSVRYAAKLASDPAGSGLAQGEQTLVAGNSSQTSTSGRWGDYSDLTVDPSDDCTFWYTQEYMNTTTVWKTRIGNFSVRSCTTSPRGAVQGTVTNCQTGLPVPNALVKISGGFSRATDAAGTYNATVPPGTYTATVTGTGYDTATSGSLVVSNGGTATFSACLNGTLKQPVADTSSVVTDSCNSNGVIDPNETVTVNLGIKNTGTLNTVNLVATMQATGGVTAPGAPQTYGVVIAGGPTVTMPFTFTASNLSCGAPLTVTLALQDGATSLGTVTYNFTVGQLLNSFYSTGNIAVAVPDNNATGVDIPITVADVMTLSDVNVTVRLNHTFVGDLKIDLVHPDNTVVNLVNRRGGSGINFGSGPNDCSGTPTGFDDQAAPLISAITSGGAPYASTFKPEGSLATLNGKPSNGTWKLRVSDNASLDAGTVGCVKLELNRRFACCGALINAAPPVSIVSESISPANNTVDPDETVTVNFPLTNLGANSTTNLVATMLPTGGVLAPSGSQSYGAIAPSGTATKAFTFTANGACGSNITASLALLDGVTNLGTVTFSIHLGSNVVTTVNSENFDSVVIPALPSGWTSTHTGGALNFVTTNTTPDSAPNDAFAPNNAIVSTIDLVSPTLQPAQSITFRNLFNLEASSSTATGFDGMVLDISFNGGSSFADIITAGGTFAAGGYTRTISSSFSSPIGGRQAWSGLSGGTTAAPTYITTTINLPSQAATQSFILRWRVATDSSASASGVNGVRVDTIATAATAQVCATQTCLLNIPSDITLPKDPSNCGAIVNYPAPTFTGGCGAVTTSQASGTFFPIGTTTVKVVGTKGDNSTTTGSFNVTVTDSETLPTGTGSNVGNNFCNTTVNYSNVTGSGQTTVVNAAPQTLSPPYTSCPGCPQLNISTTAVVTGPITTCITMPASTDFNTFSHLRLLHGEGGPALVNRTSSTNFSTKTICAVTTSLSPFVVGFDTAAPTAAPATISGRVLTPEGEPLGGVEIALSGGGTDRTITDGNGSYSFENVATDAFYTVAPARANYGFNPRQRSFSLLATKSDAVFVAEPDARATANPLDSDMFFVRQQYIDFLGREPDKGGLDYWTSQLGKCGSDGACLRQRRKEISAAFFMSEEFQQAGSFVLRLYEATLGRPVTYAEFSADRTQVIGGPNLEMSKIGFVDEWVKRPSCKGQYPDALSHAEFVNRLFETAGMSAFTEERQKAIEQLENGATRAQVLRSLVETDAFQHQQYNSSFVLMEYFGYLKRQPEDEGYRFWLDVLDNRDAGNYHGMVCSFVTSAEYQQRFSPVITHSNRECGQ
jgi:subtilisin-like proprotein convertase family protein